MSSWVNRTVLSGSSVDANGTNSHTCTFTPATSGNLLIAVVAGGVTFTTPSGWTLVQSAINNAGLYVFSKTASASESSFNTTHNGTNYAIKAVVYEFYAGSATIGTPGTAVGQTTGSTVTGPNATGLSGTYTRFATRSINLGTGVTGSTSCTWTTPSVEDYDDYISGNGSTDGIGLTIAYDDGATGSSFTPSSTLAVSASNGESVSFALSIVPPPKWVNRTALSGSSVNANGTNSHTCTFTPATSGNLLVAVVAGSVTFTTPSGWTLRQSGVTNAALYLFTKTASAGEPSFSTTHNGSNYPIMGVVYEFAAGSSYLGGNVATNTTTTSSLPVVSSLTGTYSRFGARAWSMNLTNSSASCAWTTPTVEDYDASVPEAASADGIFLTVAYDDNITSSTFTQASTTSLNNVTGGGEAISFALSVTPPTTPLPWLRFN